MPQTVTLEDYAYDIERRVLADPDPWSEVPFLTSRIADAPLDMEGRRSLLREFLGEMNRLQPDWLIIRLEDAPTLAMSPMARAEEEADRWKWIQFRKGPMD